jgi:hypothetical protein
MKPIKYTERKECWIKVQKNVVNKTNEKDNNDKYKIKDKERYQQKDK